MKRAFPALAACLGALALAACGEAEAPMLEASSEWQYDVSKFKAVDPALVKYAEADPVDPGLEALHAVAAGPEGQIAAAGGPVVKVFSAEAAPAATYEVAGEVRCLAYGPGGRLVAGVRQESEGGVREHVAVWTVAGERTDWRALDPRGRITSVAASEGAVYVADAGNRVVLKCGWDGQVQARIGRKDEDADIPGLEIPSPYCDVAVEGTFVWVANTGRRQLECYAPDGSLVDTWGEASVQIHGFSGCCNPAHVAIGPRGGFFTSEKGSLLRVKRYTPQGRFDCVVAAPDAFDEGTMEADVAVDARGRVLVADPKRKTVRVFVRTPDEVAEATP